MSPNVARKPPHGTRLAKAEVEQRLAVVEEMMAEGACRAEIAATMRARFGTAGRTVNDYMRRVRERWEIEEAEVRPCRREAARPTWNVSLDSGIAGLCQAEPGRQVRT